MTTKPPRWNSLQMAKHPLPMEWINEHLCLQGDTLLVKRAFGKQVVGHPVKVRELGPGGHLGFSYPKTTFYDLRRRNAYAHRVIMALHAGYDIDPVMDVDHINGDPRDNRISNLRIVSRAENQHNRQSKTPDRHVGVSYHARGRYWTAYVYVGNRKVDIRNASGGVTFRTQAEAALARSQYDNANGISDLFYGHRLQMHIGALTPSASTHIGGAHND